MSKFNKTKTIKTTNRSGHVAYSMVDKELLVTEVLTTMFGEPKFYGSTDNDLVELATKMCETDPKFVAQLAIYARQEFNMRSVSHVLTSVIARHAHEYTRSVIARITVRPDDLTEIMSCYKSMYGKPFPNAMKREVGVQMQKFDEYQLAKYNGGKKELKLRDVLRITHPVPKNSEVAELFGKVLSDTLEIPYTWETELSTRGNTKEVWDELIASGKLGYMAMLRNLRNIAKSGANMQPVIERIGNSREVKKSRQLPFRFFSAYKELKSAGLMTPELFKALEKAVTVSTENMDKLQGRTLIAVDKSGSMGYSVSSKSSVTCVEIGALLGAMASKMCEDATIVFFTMDGTSWSVYGKKGYQVKHFGKYDSVLRTCLDNCDAGGGTDMSLPMNWALNEDTTSELKPFDRVIYLSDNECNFGKSTIQSYADAYRRKFNPDFWVHAIDLQGYGTQQFYGKNFNLIAGWSEKVLSFIPMAEQGTGSLISAISEVDI